MLNTVSFEDSSPNDKLNVALLHIIYVFMVPVLLVNVLIAIFSNSMAMLAPHRTNILTFHNHLTACNVDNFMRIFKGHYLKQRKKAFAHIEDRLYLVLFEQ